MNDILTREQYERLIDRKMALDVLDTLQIGQSQKARMLARWDSHHSGYCRCPNGEEHGVRLSSEDWDGNWQEEMDDAEAYKIFGEEAEEREL